jgi:hypothetical protein
VKQNENHVIISCADMHAKQNMDSLYLAHSDCRSDMHAGGDWGVERRSHHTSRLGVTSRFECAPGLRHFCCGTHRALVLKNIYTFTRRDTARAPMTMHGIPAISAMTVSTHEHITVQARQNSHMFVSVYDW